MEPGKLFLCATPIGNLGDISRRVLETLEQVDLIAAEDTRNSIKLLNHFDIRTPMTSYHEYNKVEKDNPEEDVEFYDNEIEKHIVAIEKLEKIAELLLKQM